MKYRLCSNELEQRFVIVDEANLPIAYPITQRSQQTAKWRNKKLSAGALWKSVTTPEERQRVRMLLASQDMFELLEDLLSKDGHGYSNVPMPSYYRQRIESILKNITDKDTPDGSSPT